MPELPEVETARIQLLSWAHKKTIQRAFAPKASRVTRKIASPAYEALSNQLVSGCLRKGKHLILSTEGGLGIYLHLGMTGKFVRHTAGEAIQKHDRLILELTDSSQIVFKDPRMFGLADIGPQAELEAEYYQKLGPDPLIGPFDSGTLAAALSRTRRAAKIALMDQALIAGIGNIQAAEALWIAKIHPEQPANSLKPDQIEALYAGINETIQRTLAALDPEDVRYLHEGGENPFRVYPREGEPCFRCPDQFIHKIVQGGRSTFFCPSCQELST